MYVKHTHKLKEEINLLLSDLGKTDIKSSNLEKAVEKCLSIAQNISHTWATAGFENKRRLQSLVFPEGIMYNKENNEVRTEKVNSLFSLIQPLQSIVAENKKGNLKKDYLNSVNVPTKGIEPSLPCENQILSLARLPIPPYGL